MRLRELFKDGVNTDNEDRDSVLNSGPPYPAEDNKKVRHMQSLLSRIGYNVGSTGVDGKYGPRTSRAVGSFKKDYKLAGTPYKVSQKDLDLMAKIASGTVPKAASSSQPGASADSKTITKRNEFGTLPTDSVTKGKIGAVLDLIAKPESNGRYDSVYPGRRRPEILSMTLDELFQDMRIRGKKTGSSASGRYQYIRKTLTGVARQMGLDTSKEKFNPELQDEIVIFHLRNSHGLDRWLAGGETDEKFLNRLAKTWAGIPTSAGKSFYAGDSIGNKAGLSAQAALAQLDNIRTGIV